MRSWFCLATVVCLVLSVACAVAIIYHNRVAGLWFLAQVAFGLTLALGIVSIARRERWRTASGFLLGLTLGVWSWFEVIVGFFTSFHMKVGQ